MSRKETFLVKKWYTGIYVQIIASIGQHRRCEKLQAMSRNTSHVNGPLNRSIVRILKF